MTIGAPGFGGPGICPPTIIPAGILPPGIGPPGIGSFDGPDSCNHALRKDHRIADTMKVRSQRIIAAKNSLAMIE
jgi:hypothetical protein